MYNSASWKWEIDDNINLVNMDFGLNFGFWNFLWIIISLYNDDREKVFIYIYIDVDKSNSYEFLFLFLS